MPNAIVMAGYGPPEVLEWAQGPLQEPGEGQVRIKVKAAGISPTDLALRAGYLKDIPLPPDAVLGFEAAGTLDAAGPGGTGTAPGAAVTGAAAGPGVTGTSPGDAVTALLFGLGGYAEYAVASIWTRKPDAVSWLRAAALARLAGAGGGALGQVDAVFDAAGKGVLADAVALAGGPERVITLSDPAAADFGVTLSEPTPGRAPGALDETIALLAEGRLRLRAHTSIPMQEAAEAHRQLEAGPVHQRMILTLTYPGG